MALIRIFISSVQSEFAQERAALYQYIHEDALMRRFFDVFLFENAPAADRSPESLYLDEVTRCEIYVGLFGRRYGSTDASVLSPTEREFDHATHLRKHRLIYLKRNTAVDPEQDSRMADLTAKAAKQLTYSDFSSIADLRRELQESLVNYLLKNLFPKLDPSHVDSSFNASNAKAILRRYVVAFERVHRPPTTLTPFGCVSGAREISSHEVLQSLPATRENILLLGSSGGGKTLLATNAALDHIRRDGVPVFLRVKDYTNNLASTLDREAPLLDISSVTSLLSAAQLARKQILLVVDGYNECHDALWESLTIEAAAWAHRYDARLLVTSRVSPVRADLLELRTVEVLPPALEAKISIARNATKLDTLPRELEPLLSAVTTGLEAHLVGVVGRRLPPTGSRFALFDTYSRTRLGPDATAGITALSRIAGWLVDRLTFSLTVRDLDRLLDDGRIPSDMSIRLHRAGLLSSHGDRVSFAHELFLMTVAGRRAGGGLASRSRGD